MRKKICFIASSPLGIVSFHRTNFDKLSKEFDIYVIANFVDKYVFKDLCIVDAFPVSIARKPSVWSNLKAILAIYKIFRREHFDCFVSMSPNASLVAALAGFVARVPHRIQIFTGQVWANMSGLRRALFKVVDKLDVLLDTEILVDGKPQLQYLIENGILKSGQGTVLANGSICGVDVEKFKPNAEIRKIERQKIGVSDDTVVFAFMGRVNKDKGIYELLAAANSLFAEVSNAVLVLIGNMEGLTSDILINYPNLQRGKNIIIYGYTSTPHITLQLSDVFCLPSYREGFGMSVIEAASLSLPVICSDAYGLRDAFIQNETGLECKVADVDSLFVCMKKLYDDKLMRNRLGNNGRKRVVEKFNKELVSNAWREYLHNLW